MRAIDVRNYTLVPADLPIPTPASDEVLIRVVTAGVNRADLHQAAGAYPPPKGHSPILGLECAGVVVDVGLDVDRALLGRPVAALLDGGGYAEYVTAPETQLFVLDDAAGGGADFVRAAALPEALCTAWYNLVGLCGLRKGQSVLIHGGSGGVGHVAIQLAKALGARVLATVGSEAKGERCRELGADVVINYNGDVPAAVVAATEGWGVNVILDVLGGGGLAANLGSLAVGGQLAIIGTQQGRRAELDIGKLLARRLTIHGSTLRARTRTEKAMIVANAREFWGLITPVVHAVVPLEAADKAHRMMNDEKTFGKIVLEVGPVEAATAGAAPSAASPGRVRKIKPPR